MAIYNFNNITPDTYISLIKSSIVKPRFRLSLLYNDESFKEDITKYLMPNSGNLSINYQQGQRRSLNFTLDNSDGKFTPDGLNGKVWLNTKFKLELGLEMPSGDIIFNSAGIFVVGDPNASRQSSQKTIDIQCYDKFALLDGTLGGVLEASYQIDADINVLSAMQDTLLQDNGNGYPIDLKPIIFDSLYKDEVTQYQLSKSPNESLGDILIDLANMISCDIWYDINGNLTVRSGTVDISHVNKPTLWRYSDQELEYLNSTTTYNFTKCKNRVTVVAANTNSNNIYTGLAENKNPQSPTRISVIGIKNKYLEDNNISSDILAQQRAEYELNKFAMLELTIKVESAYMIHLDVNNCIAINDDFFEYYDDRFIIQSLSIPIAIDSKNFNRVYKYCWVALLSNK